MKTLSIEATKSTPSVVMNAETHQIMLNGESYPENTGEFYEAFFNWLSAYLKKEYEETLTVNIELTYFNSSSSKTLMDLFDLLEEKSEGGKDIVVNWHYHSENDMVEEYGEEFQEDMEELKFNLVPIEEE